MRNSDKIILDLCGGTGAWSRPYAEADYEVRNIDILYGQDVRLFTPPDNVYGILAAPPCTWFCRMRMCRGRPTDDQFKEGLSVVDACLRIIIVAKPKFWALENPQGYLKIWLGEPVFKFHPYQFGDLWTKRTWLWGNFNKPAVALHGYPKGIYIDHHKGRGRGLSEKDKNNAVTPLGFARAFYEANN